MFIATKAVSWALEESLSERTARLVLVVVASHCNDDGYCWPGLEKIERCSNLSRPSVLEAIRKLVELGEMEVVSGGRGPRDTNHYYLSAFMESRVKKGKENTDKGKVYSSKSVNPSLHEESVLEQSELERIDPSDIPQEELSESQVHSFYVELKRAFKRAIGYGFGDPRGVAAEKFVEACRAHGTEAVERAFSLYLEENGDYLKKHKRQGSCIGFIYRIEDLLVTTETETEEPAEEMAPERLTRG